MAYPSDETVTALRKIENYAHSIKLRAGYLRTDVDRLLYQPAWVTRAQDELERAERDLAEAHRAVKYALLQLKNKPIEPNK